MKKVSRNAYNRLPLAEKSRIDDEFLAGQAELVEGPADEELSPEKIPLAEFRRLPLTDRNKIIDRVLRGEAILV